VSAIVYLLLRSKHGLALTAIRDSERASESLGVETYRTKLMIYVVTAACTGVVGVFIFLQKLRLSPEPGFSINDWTLVVIFMVVIGGIGTLEGPTIGMLIYFVLREFLANYGTWYLILLGVVAVAIMLWGPRRHLGPGGVQVQSAPVLGAALFDAVVVRALVLRSLGLQGQGVSKDGGNQALYT
jgi:branched-chain amino acid transport system permease protein